MPTPPHTTTPPASRRPDPAPNDDAPGRIGGPSSHYGAILTGLGLVYLAVAALGKLVYALPHLLRDIEEWSAIDLKYRYGEVSHWFAGNPVYGAVDGAVYPPASHAILWPFLGWLDLDGARLMWAGTTIAALGLLALLVYRLCRPAPARYRLLAAGLVPAAYPAQMSIFVGQMGMHVVALAAAGALLVLVDRPRWWHDIVGGLLLAASLVKPTLALPVVVAALIAGGRLRPAVSAIVAYGAVTAVAASAQPDGVLVLFREWLAVSGGRVSLLEGVPNLHMLLAWAGLERWMMAGSLLALAGMAVWVGRWRRADPWVLLGIAAIVARFWTHSRLYDDGLLLLAVIALFRVAVGATPSLRRPAVALFAAAWAALLTPTWVFYGLGDTALRLAHATHAVLWLGVLALLGAAIMRGRPDAATPMSVR